MAKVIFYTSFIFLFICGGFVNYFGILPIKMAYIPLFAFLLIPYAHIYDKVFISTVLFYCIIVVSGIINNASWITNVLAVQYVLSPFCVYYIAKRYINQSNIEKIINLCVSVSLLQLPIIVIQKLFYKEFSRFATVDVGEIDIGFGSFYTSNDPAMAFFLLSIIAFILFGGERSNIINKNKYFILIWLTITILLTNSKLSLLLVIIVWALYFVRNISFKVFLSLGIISAVAIFLFSIIGYSDQLENNYSEFISQISLDIDPLKAEEFYLSSMGQRQSAIIYHLTQPLKLIGEGPFSYFDPITKTYNYGGDAGQVFSLYVEIGLIGVIISYLVYLCITFQYTITKYSFILLFFIFMYSFTVNLYMDPSIGFTFCIFMSTNIIKQGSENIKRNMHND